eukprot:UN32615
MTETYAKSIARLLVETSMLPAQQKYTQYRTVFDVTRCGDLLVSNIVVFCVVQIIGYYLSEIFERGASLPTIHKGSFYLCYVLSLCLPLYGFAQGLSFVQMNENTDKSLFEDNYHLGVIILTRWWMGYLSTDIILRFTREQIDTKYCKLRGAQFLHVAFVGACSKCFVSVFGIILMDMWYKNSEMEKIKTLPNAYTGMFLISHLISLIMLTALCLLLSDFGGWDVVGWFATSFVMITLWICYMWVMDVWEVLTAAQTQRNVVADKKAVRRDRKFRNSKGRVERLFLCLFVCYV